ncbi:MAG: undecaprenyl-diphosphate phosphatase [Candidatus Bathyarchaeota archaeon]
MVGALEAVIVGALQGVLEWLPVSSEGNLVLFMVSLLGLEATETLRLAVFLHIGTGFAALIYYREQVVEILLGKSEDGKRLRLLLTVITFVTGVVGLPVYLLLDVSVVQGETIMIVTGLALILTGLMQRINRDKGNRNSGELSWTEAVLLGVSQGLAIIPGLSRSGVTTAFLILRGFSVGESFKLSFLMSIPASFAAGLGLMALEGATVSQASLIGLLSAAVTGFIAMGALIRLAERTSFWKICVGLGAVALLASTPILVGFLIR